MNHGNIHYTGTLKMKNLFIFVLVISTLMVTGYAEIGDVWDLSTDFQNDENPSLWIDPVPTGGGSGRWSYLNGSEITPFDLSVASNPSTECYHSLPTCGIGWTISPSGSHLCLNQYCSADGSRTVYVDGDIGGHAPIGVMWGK